ncbi:MAG: ABC transporter permease, partial [Cytophagaceae bacterium]|nr:ABC transporter permease [Gemmatimonadaceae bacterium]
LARRRALAAFGGVERAKEDYRDHRGDRALGDFASDVSFALRLLRRNPTMALTVIATLALGMGSVVAIFSAVSAVMLRPLPFVQPGRLVALWEDNDDKGWRQQTAAPANMLDWQERVSAFSSVAAYSDFSEESIFSGNGESRPVRGVGVTGNFFRVLGVQPALGTVFEDGDTWRSGRRTIVLSHGMWQERLGGDANVIGRRLMLDGNDVEVIGVMGPGFAFPNERIEAWQPMAWNPADRTQVWFRRAHWIRPIARLRDGVTEQQAAAELTAVMTQLEREYPETNTRMEAGLGSLHDWVIGTTRRPLLVLLGATALLLLIACANVGNLLLVRAAAREREVVLRRALGAAWGRIVRQALTESAVLSAFGGTAGLLIGWWGTRLLAAWQPPGLLPVSSVQPDLRVFLVVLVLSAVSAAIFGAAPALWSAQRLPVDALKESTRGSSQSRRVKGWVNALAVAEVALAVTLTVGAGLLVRSYQRLSSVDPGFRAEGVVTATVVLPGTRYDSVVKVNAFVDRLESGAGALPGVESAAITSYPPLVSNAWTGSFAIRGRGPDGSGPEVQHRQVTANYFRTLGVPILAGRDFTAADAAGSEPVMLINKAFADRYFNGRDPIGQFIAGDQVPDSNSVWRRVVGVVGGERQRDLGAEPGIEFFEPIRQTPRLAFSLVVRSATDPSALFRPIERLVTSLDPMAAVVATTTMDDLRARSVARERFLALLFATFASVGALLAVVGVYGVVAQVAQRRMPEMGIRMALGAEPGHVRWMILRYGLVLTAVGSGIGSAVAMVAGGSLHQLLFQVSPRDALTHALVIGGILLTGVLASWLPARRVTRQSASVVLSR